MRSISPTTDAADVALKTRMHFRVSVRFELHWGNCAAIFNVWIQDSFALRV
jgi:hypothetical protein